MHIQRHKCSHMKLGSTDLHGMQDNPMQVRPTHKNPHVNTVQEVQKALKQEHPWGQH